MTVSSAVDPSTLATFSNEQVAKHCSSTDCWISYRGKVFNVTDFLLDHPGGDDLILEHAGRDVSEIMEDVMFHQHSDSAYEILDTYLVGKLAQTAQDIGAPKKVLTSVSSEAQVPKAAEAHSSVDSPLSNSQTSENKPPVSSKLGKKGSFIDLEKPMLRQVWESKYSKAYYLEQVHIPRYTNVSAPIFGNPFMEVLTKTPWYVVPIFWFTPWLISLYWSFQLLPTSLAVACFVAGIALWTILEYCIHRFVFHVEVALPDNRVGITLHFLLHGIHHFLPMDRMRLVMPPALSVILGFVLWSVFATLLSEPIEIGLAAGVIPSYVSYDLIHYYLHHGRPMTSHLREMKTYHMDHHYKDANLGYGITNKIWDRVFGTML